MTSQPVWNIADHIATLAAGQLTAQVDLAKPELGVRAIRVADTPFVGASLLGVYGVSKDEPAKDRLTDLYVRGLDLVADYAIRSNGLHLRVYWSPDVDDQSPDVVALALTASLRTDCLNVQPDVRCHSCLPAAGAQRLDAELSPESLDLTPQPTDVSAEHTVATLSSCPGGLVYAEMPHPVDVLRSTISRSADAEGMATITHELFTDHLEKGVIVRARVLGLILPQDEQTIGRIDERHRAFAAMNPPLDA